MADVITRFKLETTQYDSKLRDEAKRLSDFAKTASLAGNEFGKFTQKNVEAARAFGNIATSATNSKEKVKELVSAFNTFAKGMGKWDSHSRKMWSVELDFRMTQILELSIKDPKGLASLDIVIFSAIWIWVLNTKIMVIN